MDAAQLQGFGTKYTAAWCSQKAASVAAFVAENGSLKINDGAASVGGAAITTAAQGFMTAFPEMVVAMDSISGDGRRSVYRWTLTGSNTVPGGTGKPVRHLLLQGGGMQKRVFTFFSATVLLRCAPVST